MTLCYCFTVSPYLTVTWHCHTFPLLYHTLLSPWLRAIVPPLCTITGALVPLFHRTLLSLWHCSITLYYYCETGCATVPLLYHSLLSLRHYATQFHHTFLSLSHCSTTFYYHCDSVLLFHCFTILNCYVTLSHFSTVVPHFTVTVTPCHCSATLYYHWGTSATFPPNFTITVTLFHHTLLLLWDRLCHCSTVVPLFTVTATLCHSVPPHFFITIPLFHHILLSLWLCATWQDIVIGLSPILGRPLLIFLCPNALACAADVI